jgi:predicted dehydrogenase
LIIGTPAGEHAAQATAALERGIAVFCHHPIAEGAGDATRIVDLARDCDRLVGVDFRYRQVSGVPEMAALVRDGAIGDVFSVELAYHTAHGPEAASDAPASPSHDTGGDAAATTAASTGCLLELGSHLVDLLLHVLDAPPVHTVSGRRYVSGRRLPPGARMAEDHATAEITLGRDITARLACSWRASLGRESVIDARFIGTRGALRLRNVHGSSTAFRVEQHEGTRTRTIGGTLDAWSGRVACAWARRLATDPTFDESALRIPLVSTIIESIVAQ